MNDFERCTGGLARALLGFGRVALLAGAASLAGCAARPDSLQRDTRLDAECNGGQVAYVYTIGAPVVEAAVAAGCRAPLGAWTSESDVAAGGTRKLLHSLRTDEKRTLLCC